MKKYQVLLLVFCMLFLALPAAAQGEAELYAAAFDESFDALSQGALPPGWSADITQGSANSIGAEPDPDGGMLIKIDAGQAQTKAMLTSPSFSYGDFTASYQVRFDSARDAYQGLYLGDASTIALHASDGEFRYRVGSGSVALAPIKADGSWNAVTVYVNNDQHYVEIWINGTLAGSGDLFRTPGSGVVRQLMFGVDKTFSSVIYLDDVKVEEGYGIRQEVTMDFNQAESENADSFYPSAPGSVTLANASNLSHFDIAGGLFGKEEADKSLYIHSDAGTLEGSSDPYLLFDLKKTAAASPLAAGDTAVLDVDVAFGEEMSQIRLQGFAYSEDTAGDGKLGYEMIVLSSDGKLRIFEQVHQLSTPMESGVWHSIRLEVYAGDAAQGDPNRYSVWFDGEAVALDTAFDLKTRDESRNFVLRNQFRGFHQIWINHRFSMLQQEDGTYSAGGFYCDDLSYRVEKAEEAETAGPQIAVEGLMDGMTLEDVTELETEITATDESGVAFMEIYHNDVLVQRVEEGAYTLTLSGLEQGEHTLRIVAQDTLGNAAQRTIRFTVASFIELVLYTEDFSSYSATGGNSTLPSGVAGYSQRGYVKACIVDEEHGTSMAVGIDTANESYKPADRAYGSIPVGEATGSVTVQFDGYIERSPSSEAPMGISLKKSGSTEQLGINFSDGKMQVGDAVLDFAEKTWYTCTFKINVPGKIMEVEICPAGGGEKQTAVLEMSEGFDVVSTVRVWGPAEDMVKTFFALDNITVSKRADMPTITEIGSGGEKNGFIVDHQAQEVEIYLSEAVRASSVGDGSVKILEGERSVTITQARYDSDLGAIVATLGEGLKTNWEYQAELAGSLILESVGQEIGKPISGKFTTTHGELELLEVNFTDTQGGLRAQCTIENNTDGERAADLILAVWKGDTFVRALRETVTAGAQSTVEKELATGALLPGETAEVYFWDCTGPWPKMIANRIYRYEKE